MIFTNKVYDILKAISRYVLPALGTLYFALSSIWGLPYGEQVIGTITALNTFLGALLGISTTQYKKNLKADEMNFGTVDEDIHEQ